MILGARGLSRLRPWHFSGYRDAKKQKPAQGVDPAGFGRSMPRDAICRPGCYLNLNIFVLIRMIATISVRTAEMLMANQKRGIGRPVTFIP